MHRSFQIISFVCFFFLLTESGTGQPADSLQNELRWRPSPAGAALRSLALPGWGQAYVGHPIKAVVYGGIEQGLIYSIYREHRNYSYHQNLEDDNAAGFYKENRNRLSWYLAGAIILSMVDAYVDAHLYEFDVSDDFSHRNAVRNNRGLNVLGVNINLAWRFE